MDVPILDIENAPENSKPWLEATAKSMGGFLPNLYRQMANAPICLLYTSPSPRDRSLTRMPSSA